MKKPKMIIFDYGHTLCHEEGFNGERGIAAVLKHAVKNKNNLTAKEVSEFNSRFFTEIGERGRINEVETHHHNFHKFLYEYLGIEFELPFSELEEIFWENAAPGEIMPNADKMLDYIYSKGIRSGVISNISFSGEALGKRINRLLPRNTFEFIIATSEYIFRKPNPLIFNLALNKADLSAEQVWYCGDNVLLDVNGSANAGFFPVWYESEERENLFVTKDQKPPLCEHLYIKNWMQLIDVLEEI